MLEQCVAYFTAAQHRIASVCPGISKCRHWIENFEDVRAPGTANMASCVLFMARVMCGYSAMADSSLSLESYKLRGSNDTLVYLFGIAI